MPLGREVRRALRNVSVKALSLGLERACRLIVILAAAPALGQAAFGRFVFASTVTALLALGTELGLGLWTTRSLARHRGDGGAIVRTGLALRAIAAGPYALAVLAVAGFTSAGESRWAMLLLGAAALLNALVDHFGAILRGLERFPEEARLNASRALLTALCSVVILTGARSLVGLCLALAVAAAASFAYGSFGVARLFREQRPPNAWRLDKALAGRALRESLPMWIAGLLSILYFKADTVFLRAMTSDAELGAYGAAYKLFEGVMVVPAVILAVSFPGLSRAHGDPRAQRALELRVGAVLLALGLGVGAVFLVGGGPLVRLLFGAAFGRAAFSLRVLAVGLPFLFLNYGLTHFLLARDLGRATSWLAFAMLVINVTLNVVLIPRAGGPGAAWATVLTELALTLGCFGFLRLAATPPEPASPRRPEGSPRARAPGATRRDQTAA